MCESTWLYGCTSLTAPESSRRRWLSPFVHRTDSYSCRASYSCRDPSYSLSYVFRLIIIIMMQLIRRAATSGHVRCCSCSFRELHVPWHHDAKENDIYDRLTTLVCDGTAHKVVSASMAEKMTHRIGTLVQNGAMSSNTLRDGAHALLSCDGPIGLLTGFPCNIGQNPSSVYV